MTNTAIRIGILGAARVAPYALIEPAARVPSIGVTAIASRSLDKARAFAARHGIPKAFGSYGALLADREIDAVYVALPPALHAEWTIRALDAAKHVLCEKPMAVQARQAAEMAGVARARRRVLQEAMHTRFSRVLQRQRELIRDGTLGPIVHIVSTFRHPNIPMLDEDFRLQAELGGGAALDLGCYAVSALRYVAGEEPEVRDAASRGRHAELDDWMRARIVFPSGATGTIECGFHGTFEAKAGVEVDCERGAVRTSPGGLLVTREGRGAQEEVVSSGSTYERQLDAFARQIRGELSEAPGPEDAIATARVLEAMYERAGLTPRGMHVSS